MIRLIRHEELFIFLSLHMNDWQAVKKNRMEGKVCFLPLFFSAFVVELLYAVWCLLSPNKHKSVY